MMPADVARCQGVIYLSGHRMKECPKKETCRRYVEPSPPGAVILTHTMPNRYPCELYIEVEE